MSHEHAWVEAERFYSPPAHDWTLKGIPPKELRHLILGVTTILDRCTTCGETRTQEILGKSLA